MATKQLRALKPVLVRRTYQIRPDQDTEIQERRLVSGDSWSVIVRRLIDLGLQSEKSRARRKQAEGQ